MLAEKKLCFNCTGARHHPDRTVIMSPGKETLDLTNTLLTQTSHLDYGELCRLDVLGLSKKPTDDQRTVYAEFKEQLV